MSTRINSTTRTVLANLDAGRDMWQGVPSISPGAGIPSVVTSLLKRGMIRRDGRGYVITELGRDVLKEASK
jgi:predicted methyltransferase